MAKDINSVMTPLPAVATYTGRTTISQVRWATFDQDLQVQKFYYTGPPADPTYTPLVLFYWRTPGCGAWLATDGPNYAILDQTRQEWNAATYTANSVKSWTTAFPARQADSSDWNRGWWRIARIWPVMAASVCAINSGCRGSGRGAA